MSDISKIQLMSGTYNIKDDTGRLLINQLETNTNKNISLLSYKKIIIIGDSYTTGDNSLGDHITPYPDYLSTMIEGVGEIVKVNGSNGSGFIVGKTFLTQLLEIENDITNKEEITDIVVIGGYNERFKTTEEILEGIVNFVEYVNETYPNAKTKIGFVGYSARNDYGYEQNAITGYQQCSKLKRCLYLTNSEYILTDLRLFGNDGFHPNEDGQKTLALKLKECIFNGVCDISNNIVNIVSTNFQWESFINTGDSRTSVGYLINNENGYKTLTQTNVINGVIFNSTQTMNNNDRLKIATINNKEWNFRGSRYGQTNIPIMATINYSDSAPFLLEFYADNTASMTTEIYIRNISGKQLTINQFLWQIPSTCIWSRYC